MESFRFIFACWIRLVTSFSALAMNYIYYLTYFQKSPDMEPWTIWALVRSLEGGILPSRVICCVSLIDQVALYETDPEETYYVSDRNPASLDTFEGVLVEGSVRLVSSEGVLGHQLQELARLIGSIHYLSLFVVFL